MGLYTTVILIALALLNQNKLAEARACNGRSTVIQVRVPQKTNVTIKYPSQIDPVKFVRPNEPEPQCLHCSKSKCQKCNKFNPNARTTLNRKPTTRTNIVIDLKGSHPKKDNTNKDIYDTLVYIGDKNSATSVSNSSAKSTEGAAASTSAAATTSNTALIAAFNENANNGSSNTENVYLEDTSQSFAKSSANASAGEPEPSKQQPQAEKIPSQLDQVPPSEQVPAPKEQPASEKQPAPGQLPDPRQEPEQPTKPNEKPAQQLPEEKSAQQLPEEKPSKQLPEEKPSQQLPEEKPSQQMPEEKPSQQLPEEKPSKQLPEEKPAQQLPEEKPSKQLPEEKPTLEKEKQPEPLSPTTKAGEATEPEESPTDKQAKVPSEAVPSSPEVTPAAKEVSP